MNKIDTIYASRVPLYPPRVTPPPKPLNLPAALYVGSWSHWVTDPALVKIVLLDRCDDFPQDPLLRRVLGPLFGNGILTSEGRDWRWQHQTVAPLFRHDEILRYVPARVAGAALAITLLEAALRLPREMATFGSAGVSRAANETPPGA